MKTFQHNKPLFVKDRHRPIVYKGFKYSYNKALPWQEVGMPEDKVQTLFNIGRVYHNEELEVTLKVGDRLAEMDLEQIKELVRKYNTSLKKITTSKEEFEKYKIKSSTIEMKQRGLIKSWLNRTGSSRQLVEEFYKIRDEILGE